MQVDGRICYLPDVATVASRDRVILALVCFFILTAWTLDLYWFIYRDQLVERSRTDWIARAYANFSDADRGYYDRVTKVEVALEAINISITQALNLWLIFAILRNRPYRYALQLAIGSYVAYSVILDYFVAHLGGYPAMRYHSTYTLLMFYGASSPWVLGHLYLVYDAIVAINHRFRGLET